MEALKSENGHELGAVDSLAALYNNPFIFLRLFHAFYNKLPPLKNNYLLCYLVLPLALNPELRKFIANANSKSNLHTLVKDRTRLSGLPERVQRYKNLTSLSMQYAYNSGTLALSDSLEVVVIGNPHGAVEWPANATKIGTNLAKLFSPFEIETIYRTLGVKQL